MRALGLAVAAAALLLASAAAAEERPSRRWDIDVRASWVIVGPAERLTGGVMPNLSVRHSWAAGGFDLAVGGELGAFGFADETRWIGVLGGVTAGASWRPADWFSAEVTARIDGGRIPVCNAWGLCLRYVGLFPAADVAVGFWASKVIAGGVAVTGRYVDTLAWTGVGWEPAAFGRFYW